MGSWKKRSQWTGWRIPSFRRSGFFGKGRKQTTRGGMRVGGFLVGLLGSWFRPETEHIGLDHPDGPGASFEGGDYADPVFNGP